MTDSSRAGETLKSALDLSLQYYSSLLRLSTDYLQSLGSLVARKGQPVPERASAAPPRPPLLLVGRLGDEATASFLVENSLNEQVVARLSVHGTGPAAALTVHPEAAALRPGEQCVVQARVTIASDMAVGEDYFGELAVPELASRTIPFVIRRVADPKADG